MILHEDFMKNGRELCEDGAGQSDRSEVSGRSDRWAQGGVGIFIDGIMIRREDRELLEESLSRWKYVPERRRMEINRKKTDYVCECERDRWTCEEFKVDEFKYLWLRL